MTDQGVYGLGDATLNNRETLPAAYLQDYLIPNLIGMDPRRSASSAVAAPWSRHDTIMSVRLTMGRGLR